MNNDQRKIVKRRCMEVSDAITLALEALEVGDSDEVGSQLDRAMEDLGAALDHSEHLESPW